MTFCHCTVWFLLKIHDCLISFASEIAALMIRSIYKLNWLLNSRQQVTDTVQRHQMIYTYLNSSEAMWKRKVLRSNWPKTTKKQLICLEEIELNHKPFVSLVKHRWSKSWCVCLWPFIFPNENDEKNIFKKQLQNDTVTLTSFALLCAIVIIFDFLSYLSCLFFVCSYNSSSPREKWTTIIPTSAW